MNKFILLIRTIFWIIASLVIISLCMIAVVIYGALYVAIIPLILLIEWIDSGTNTALKSIDKEGARISKRVKHGNSG